MPRKKPEPNVYERYADSVRPYLAERVLFGEYDVLESVVVPAVDADGSLVAAGYELEPVTDPRIVAGSIRFVNSTIVMKRR